VEQDRPIEHLASNLHNRITAALQLFGSFNQYDVRRASTRTSHHSSLGGSLSAGCVPCYANVMSHSPVTAPFVDLSKGRSRNSTASACCPFDLALPAVFLPTASRFPKYSVRGSKKQQHTSTANCFKAPVARD
jgi:hypothetical protein